MVHSDPFSEFRVWLRTFSAPRGDNVAVASRRRILRRDAAATIEWCGVKDVGWPSRPSLVNAASDGRGRPSYDAATIAVARPR